MKTITIWKDGNNLGSQFRDDDKPIFWETKLSLEEKADFVNALYQFAEFFGSLLEHENQRK